MVVTKEASRDPDGIHAVSGRSSAPKPEDFKAHEVATTSSDNKQQGTDPDAWYSGVLSSFFGGAQSEDDRNCSDSRIPSVACGKTSFTDKSVVAISSVALPAPIVVSPNSSDEVREDIEDESTSSETVSTLGKGLTDDLKSLPSVQGGILPGDDGSLSLEDNLIWPMKKSSFTSRSNRIHKTESVEAVVEKKINNLKAERSTNETDKKIPYLRRKMYPNTSTALRIHSGSPLSPKQDSVLETRRQLLVHELRHAVQTNGRFDVRCANITAALGDLYDENSEYKQALRLHKDAVSVYSSKLGDDHESTLTAKLRLGQVQENAGAYNDAVSTFYNVMCMTKALKGDKDPAGADVMTRIASSLRKKGNFELAIKTLKRALKTYREILGDSHPNVSKTVDSIASLYVTVGDFDKASAILEEVVKLKAATMGMMTKEVASSLTELATCYECAEQYSKAMKNLKKAYKIYAEVTGDAGEKSILTLERIALIYQATGQFKKAAIAYLGVLRGRKRALGELHPTVADTYFHLGVSLRESGQQDKAFKCMKQALNIYVGEGKDMHDVEMIAEVMHELAMIHKANDNLGEAIKTFKQEIAVRRKLGQPEFPLTAQTLNHLGVAEFEIKNHSRALNYFMEALTIYEKRGGDLGTDFAEVLYNTGLVFESMRNKQRAHDAFLEAARIFKDNGYGSDHPHLAKAIGKLRRLGHTSSR